MIFDLATLFNTGALLKFMLALYLLMIWAEYKKDYNGIFIFVLGMLSLSTGSALIGIRAVVPVFISIVTANVLLVSGMIMIYISFRLFFNLGVSKPAALVLILIVSVTFTVQYIFGILSDNLKIRIIAISILYALPASFIVGLLVKKFRIISIPELLLIGSFSVQILVLAARIPVTLAGPAADNFLNMRGFQSFTQIMSILSSCSWPIGYALLISQELKKKAVIQNRIKETLLHELHHRTRNNLQVVIGLLNLQSEFSDSEEVRKQLLEAENRFKPIVLMHEQLYQSDDLSRIQLKDYVAELVDLISAGYKLNDKDIMIELDVDDIVVLIDTAVPIGQILSELFSNIFKYAFPENCGNISLRIKPEGDDKIKILLTDNGKGLEPDFDINGTQSLGINIVKKIVMHQLKGSVEFISDKGLQCSILITKNLYRVRI